MFPAQLQQIEVNGERIALWVPEEEAVRACSRDERQPFPFWAGVWPAARALSALLLNEPQWVKGKKVLEIAGGLGLPSIIAARWARSVVCSDYLVEPLQFVERTAAHLHLENLTTAVIDWNHLPQKLEAEVLLLSDVNYAPEQFPPLQKLIEQFIKGGTTILLSTPQRLMAKPFITSLLPYCTFQSETLIEEGEKSTAVSIYILEDR